jgi:hypothetical protein
LSMYEDDDANAAVAPVTGTGPRYAYRIPIPDHRAFQPSSLEITLGNRLGGGDPNMLVGYRLGALGDRIAAQNDYRTFLQEAMERQQQVAAMADATARRGQDAQITRTALQQPTYASLFDLSRQQITPEGLATMGQLPGLDVRQRGANIENTLAQAAQRRAAAANAGRGDADRNSLTLAQWATASRGLMQRAAALTAQEQRLAGMAGIPVERLQRDAQGRLLLSEETVRTMSPQQRAQVERLYRDIEAQRAQIANERAWLEANRPGNAPPPSMADDFAPPAVAPAIAPPVTAPATTPSAPAATAPVGAAPVAAPATPSVGGGAALQEARAAAETARAVMTLPPDPNRPTLIQIQRYITNRLPPGSVYAGAERGFIYVIVPGERERVRIPFDAVSNNRPPPQE